MAGALYIWIMLAFLIGVVGVGALLAGVLFIGHWLEKRETGGKHGFLELPEELRRGRSTTEGTEDTEKEG